MTNRDIMEQHNITGYNVKSICGKYEKEVIRDLISDYDNLININKNFKKQLLEYLKLKEIHAKGMVNKNMRDRPNLVAKYWDNRRDAICDIIFEIENDIGIKL